MNLTDGLFPPPWLWLGHVVYWPVLLWALFRAPWRHLRESESLNVLLGATVGVIVLWNLNAGIDAGLNLHLLGVTLLTLMFGWEFALMCISVVLMAVTFNHHGGWAAFPLNAVLLGVIPALLSYGIARFVYLWLPHNFFVYIFGCAFFGAAITMAVVGLISTGALGFADVYTFRYLARHYLPFFLLMVFPEGFITGMIITLLVAYRPEWVTTFSDAQYIKNK